MEISREDKIVRVGDLLAGTTLEHFTQEFSKIAKQQTDLVSNLNTTATSYQNIVVEGKSKSLQYKAAIPADIWYLWPPPPELNLVEDVNPSEKNNYLFNTLQLKNYIIDQDTLVLGILKQPRSAGEVINDESPRTIFLMRYQTIAKGESFDWAIEDFTDHCVGFIEFLVGPLGVMETLSICGEETGTVGEIILGGELIPPASIYPSDTPDNTVYKNPGVPFLWNGQYDADVSITSLLDAPSINIVKYGYLTNKEIHYPATDLAGEVSSPVHSNLRIQLLDELQYPVPGEFLALLARPFSHFAWFNQDTSPLIVGGNWFRTASYISGIVESIGCKDYPWMTNYLTVWVEGVKVYNVMKSDYTVYQVGERVALVHTYPTAKKFSYKDELPILYQTEDDYSSATPCNLMIVPITFFKKGV